jgi:hypothetical protein
MFANFLQTCLFSKCDIQSNQCFPCWLTDGEKAFMVQYGTSLLSYYAHY